MRVFVPGGSGVIGREPIVLPAMHLAKRLCEPNSFRTASVCADRCVVECGRELHACCRRWQSKPKDTSWLPAQLPK